ncbi:MAG: hypothetical protein M3071_00455 [Actinomycetota bacterium]|nr:hypothetical protein [Actinomycetota bacterium]
MEDLVALEATLRSGAKRYYLTWGRVFSPVDPEPLIETVRPYITKRQLGEDVTNIRVCNTLQEASRAPYFYEGLFDFAQQRIPDGEDYEKWAAEIREQLAKGKELYYLGADE